MTTTASPPKPVFTFDLAGARPSVTQNGNTIREANEESFPALAGNSVSFFLIDMKPGALRVPHWHPNVWELDYVLQGTARVWLTGPDNVGKPVMQVLDLSPGQLIFIPQGWFHAILCTSSVDLKLLLNFNSGRPLDIGIPAGLVGMGNAVFAQTFNVSPDVFEHFDTSNEFFAPPRH